MTLDHIPVSPASSACPKRNITSSDPLQSRWHLARRVLSESRTIPFTGSLPHCKISSAYSVNSVVCFPLNIDFSPYCESHSWQLVKLVSAFSPLPLEFPTGFPAKTPVFPPFPRNFTSKKFRESPARSDLRPAPSAVQYGSYWRGFKFIRGFSRQSFAASSEAFEHGHSDFGIFSVCFRLFQFLSGYDVFFQPIFQATESFFQAISASFSLFQTVSGYFRLSQKNSPLLFHLLCRAAFCDSQLFRAPVV